MVYTSGYYRCLDQDLDKHLHTWMNISSFSTRLSPESVATSSPGRWVFLGPLQSQTAIVSTSCLARRRRSLPFSLLNIIFACHSSANLPCFIILTIFFFTFDRARDSCDATWCRFLLCRCTSKITKRFQVNFLQRPSLVAVLSNR